MDTSSGKRYMAALCCLLMGLCAVGYGKIIYVEDNIAWLDEGTSWVSAFTHLQDALAVAEPGDEIRVAQGVYKPDRGGGTTPGDRRAAFFLPEGVTVSGGYAGLFAPDPNARDTARYVTALSGDLLDDDVVVADPCELYNAPNRTDNSTHVLIVEQVSSETVLDGFTVTGGHAWPESRGRGHGTPAGGGGLWIISGSPVVRNCVFTHNVAWAGGGVSVLDGSPRIHDCRFSLNGANGDGGGLFCDADSIELVRCVFERNCATDEGGGLYSGSSEVRLRDCIFAENRAGAGGGMMASTRGRLELTRCEYVNNRAYEGAGLKVRTFSSSPPALFVDCTFSRNEADLQYPRPGYVPEPMAAQGGGLLFSGSQAELKGCVFTANVAEQGAGLDVDVDDRCDLTNCLWACNLGGAVHARVGVLAIDRCTLCSNRAQEGGLVACVDAAGRSPADVSVMVTNSILRDDACEFCVFNCDLEDLTVTYSNVEGGWPGEGNIDVEPHFVSPGGWPRLGDSWVEGDYHLKSQAGRWDPLAREWVVDEVTSPCIDAGDPTDSIGEELFPDGGAVNMGAYAGTTQASKSYFGEPLCSMNLAGDTNGDCRIDLADLLTVLSHWWPAGPVIEEGPRVTFIEPADGATLELASEPITIMAEISPAATVAKVVFHISHTTDTFTYHGQCEGLQERNRWSVDWYWSGDSERLLSGEHVIVFSPSRNTDTHLFPFWRLSTGSFTFPDGEYGISAEITDHEGRTAVSPARTVTLRRKRVSR